MHETAEIDTYMAIVLHALVLFIRDCIYSLLLTNLVLMKSIAHPDSTVWVELLLYINLAGQLYVNIRNTYRTI